MTLSSVINHLNIEIYPKNFNQNIAGKWLIGATHHSLHHKQFKYNFGLYFTFWDKFKKTESPLYDQLFIKATSSADNRAFENTNITTGAAVINLQDKEGRANQNYTNLITGLKK